MSDDRYKAAERRVDQRVGFAVHLLAFVVVNAMLSSQSGFDPTAGYFWGWGIGLGAHALFVLASGTRVKQRLIERELARAHRP